MNILKIIPLLALLVGCSSNQLAATPSTSIGFSPESRLTMIALPIYPRQAIRQGIEGDVLLELVVGNDGKPTNIKILGGLGEPLDSAAIKATEKAQFSTRARGDKVIVTASFLLTSTI